MNARDLEHHEQVVLVAAARHVVWLDEEMSDAELFELIRIGVEIGRADFERALEATEEIHRDGEKVLELLAEVTRAKVKQKIVTELHRIASGDGVVQAESTFIHDVEAFWGLLDGRSE